MKQLVHSPKNGTLSVQDVPSMSARRGTVLVKVAVSLVSAGTERMAVEFAQKNLLDKARSRPDLVKQVLDKARREGVLSTFEAVQNRMAQPASLGYSASGVVVEVGAGVTRFRPGDRVACAGANYAVHAELISVPENLVALIPDASTAREAGGLSYEEAAFTTLGAIALHGFRLADVQLGETVSIIGLGLIGLITVQLVKAAGCRPIGMDPNSRRAGLARQLGCELVASNASEMERLVAQCTAGVGTDAVIITAATQTSEPVRLAANIARGKATVVSVGAVGTEIPRKAYFERELNFVISRSYGPGRYDSSYEEKGVDYPIEFVRWTENRNMSAFLELLAGGLVNVASLVTHRFGIEEAPEAYDLISGQREEPFLGVLLSYSDQPSFTKRVELTRTPIKGSIRVGMLGAGSFATVVLIPAMKRVAGIELAGIVAGSGVGARYAGERFGFRYCATDQNEIFNDPTIDTVAIATRHHAHAGQVISALSAGKHVFCEKPLCMNEEELSEIIRARRAHPAPQLTVGFNRRFAPLAKKMKEFFAGVKEPLSLNYRVNAGYLPESHWTQDPQQGGGRVIGEVCHFVDFLSFIADSLPASVYAAALGDSGRYSQDNLHIVLQYQNGSVATISYLANGDRSVPKERVEIVGAGSFASLDDFRQLDLVRDGKRKRLSSRFRQDKGHRGEWEAFAEALRSGAESPISFDDIVATTLATFRILESVQTGKPIDLRTDEFFEAAAGEE